MSQTLFPLSLDLSFFSLSILDLNRSSKSLLLPDILRLEGDYDLVGVLLPEDYYLVGVLFPEGDF